MKKQLFLLTAVLFSLFAAAQKQPYNIVFDITSSDTAVHSRMVRWINLITEEDPKAKIELVFYGKSIPMVTSSKSTIAPEIAKIILGNKATFVVCEVALKSNGFTKADLLPGVTTVPDGLYELVKKQAEGFGYIKVANQ